MKSDDLDGLILGEEPREEPEEHNREFKPKFNVREEFAVWVREQFPELGRYSKKRSIYKALEERREEVYQAALGAVNHGANSTQDCAANRLYSGWVGFEREFKPEGDPRKRVKILEKFVKSLEDLSISLGGDKHYTEAGKFLGGDSYSSSIFGKLNVFVYRVGDENGKDTKYLVFNEPQEFPEDNAPTLIGELTGLSEGGVLLLKKISENFTGSEKDFIRRVDLQVPERGAFGYQTGGYQTRGYGEGWFDQWNHDGRERI